MQCNDINIYCQQSLAVMSGPYRLLLPSFFATALSSFSSRRPTPISSSSNSSKTWAASCNTDELSKKKKKKRITLQATFSVNFHVFLFQDIYQYKCTPFLQRHVPQSHHYHKSLLFRVLLVHFLNLCETWTTWLTDASTNGLALFRKWVKGCQSVCWQSNKRACTQACAHT